MSFEDAEYVLEFFDRSEVPRRAELVKLLI